MIIFQGVDDKVIPPRLAHELVEALEKRGVMHRYIEYAGEGHGFRNLETRVDALQQEADFFIKVISEQV
jgi:dipeptidyl aminopeptidase/acylaminoacyl peptidase